MTIASASVFSGCTGIVTAVHVTTEDTVATVCIDSPQSAASLSVEVSTAQLALICYDAQDMAPHDESASTLGSNGLGSPATHPRHFTSAFAAPTCSVR